MISYSGVVYDEMFSTGVFPTLDDTITALSRLPRWCGSTKRAWSVLDHSRLVASLLEYEGPIAAFAGLTHDLEEGLGWGDISKDLKGSRVGQRQLRQRATYLGFLVPDQALVTSVVAIWGSAALHRADALAAAIERYHMLDGKIFDVPDYKYSVEELKTYGDLVWRLGYGRSAHQSTVLFMARFHELANLPVRRAEAIASSTLPSLFVCSVCNATTEYPNLHACHPDAPGV